MLKKLQHKFMIIAFLALASLIAVQMLAVNAVTLYQRDAELRKTLLLIAENNGKIPDGFNDRDFLEGFVRPIIGFEPMEKPPFSERYFYVEMKGNVVTDIFTENNPAVDNEKALSYAADVFGSEEGFGYLSNYMYLVEKKGNNTLIVFIDFQKVNDSVYQLPFS